LKSWAQVPRKESLEERARKERQLWGDAIQSDPLLPEQLLPADYLGKEALRQRRKRLPHLLRQVMSSLLGDHLFDR
jgi:DNA-binding transcriptional regulator PaaX